MLSIATPAITCQANDWFIAFAKWEGANGSTVTLSTNQSTSQTGAIAAVDHTCSGNDLHGRGFYGQIDSGSSIILTANFSATRPFVGIHGYVFRPAGGQILVFDAAATSTQGSSSTPATGATANAGAGATVTAFPLYQSLDLDAGVDWIDVLNTNQSFGAEYRLLTGGGSITGDGDVGSTTHWIAMMIELAEQAAGFGQQLQRWQQQGAMGVRLAH